jgi:hypothetical protein
MAKPVFLLAIPFRPSPTLSMHRFQSSGRRKYQRVITSTTEIPFFRA